MKSFDVESIVIHAGFHRAFTFIADVDALRRSPLHGQKYLTTPNRFRKFASILDPGGVSWRVMGLTLDVSAKE